MKSKPFYFGIFAVVWLVAFAISCLGPGDSGNLLLAMLFPLVACGSTAGLVWGLIERKKSKKKRSGNLTGIVLNGLIVSFAALGVIGWAIAEGWPRLPFRYPGDIPVYPGATILRKENVRDPGGTTTKSWELMALPEYGESTPQYVKAAVFYDQQLPEAEKRTDENGDVRYSYVNPKAGRVVITITKASIIRIQSSE